VDQTTDQTRCHALIVLRGRVEREYEGPAHIADRLVHCDAVRRVVTDGRVSYRPAGARSWPISQVREIRWLDAELEAAA
jgi:hypothetical protein